jgi:preprotein translocase subunit SecY
MLRRIEDAPMESSNGIRGYIDEAIRFWEPRRILYNLVLTAVTVFWFVLGWSHFRPGVNLQLLLALLVLAAAANVCYCAAYLVDIPLQYSSFRAAWRRHRWWLWLAGVLLAMLLASYWINDEIWPGVGTTSVSALIK